MRSGAKSRLFPVAAAALLLALTAGTAQASRLTKSFDATFCFTQAESQPAGSGQLSATVSWSGYRVDGVSIGVGDGSGAGYGYIEPVDPASRTGEVTISLGVDNASPFGGVDIRLGNHVWESRAQNAPSGNWANLTACA